MVAETLPEEWATHQNVTEMAQSGVNRQAA
jgi:hypothetical protein